MQNIVQKEESSVFLLMTDQTIFIQIWRRDSISAYGRAKKVIIQLNLL